MPSDFTSPDHSGVTHPLWCSPAHCSSTPDGGVVHQQAPRRWTEDDVTVEMSLIAQVEVDGTAPTYLQLKLSSLQGWEADPLDVWVGMATAQRLYDQLGAHVHAAARGSVVSS